MTTNKTAPSSKKVFVPKEITPQEKRVFRMWEQEPQPKKKETK